MTPVINNNPFKPVRVRRPAGGEEEEEGEDDALKYA